LETRPALKAYDEQRTPIKDLVDDDLVLLPGRVIGYPFRLRRFVILDVNSLLDIPKPEDVWKDLCIDRLHKKLVKSLVKSHLAKHNLRKCHPEAHQDQDIIRGKGNSLVFLLHGPPGVGKTATAEAVARANKKPLFPITCGDLGFTPDNVERALNDIFRLANIWDCILLLDEADIFLSRRELNQMERNALVSGKPHHPSCP
jgi:ATP-dependent protease Clp ATPase subunit